MFPVGDVVVDIHVQAFYNVAFGLGDAEGITNVGDWTAEVHAAFRPPQCPSPISLLTRYRPQSFETEPGSMGCEKSGYGSAGLE